MGRDRSLCSLHDVNPSENRVTSSSDFTIFLKLTENFLERGKSINKENRPRPSKGSQLISGARHRALHVRRMLSRC